MQRLLHLKASLVAGDQFWNSNRQTSSIDREEFKRVVYGPNYQARDKCLEIIKQNPQLFEHYHLTEASRSYQRQKTTQQLVWIKDRMKDISQTGRNDPNIFTVFSNGFTFYDLNIVTKLGVHYSLYLKTLERLGTTPLHRQLYERAYQYQDFGCFALTELLHGSNVKGLLTQAHYDHSSSELVIHSPTKDAMKFWIGGAAKTSNMSIIWAQIYIEGKCHGVHAIVVPLRDEHTHKVLPGITIGDCGPKFGLNGVDNGFILFNRFRVPVANLLNKISGINEKGQFFNNTSSQNKRFGMTLAALSQGRLFMCCHSTTLALSALAIALRYTFVRRQFQTRSNPNQKYLIEYPLTVKRMVPLLALEIVYMSVTMNTFYSSQNREEKHSLSPDNPVLQQIHAISSVLKAKTAWAATETIRDCRQMMGGHGYSAYSKMAALYSNNDVNNTWEGQNNVLVQQTTKYVLDNFQKAMSGKPVQSPTLKFLQDPPQEHDFQVNRKNLVDFEAIRRYLRSRVTVKAQELGLKMMELKEAKMGFMDIWNNVQVYQGKGVSLYVTDLYILDHCLTKMKEIKDKNTRKVFENILHVWCMTMLKNDEGINEMEHALIERVMMEYSDKLFPEILGILQTLVAGEEVLGSPFASQDGQGFKKYMNFVLTKPRKERSDYWQLLASK